MTDKARSANERETDQLTAISVENENKDKSFDVRKLKQVSSPTKKSFICNAVSLSYGKLSYLALLERFLPCFQGGCRRATAAGPKCPLYPSNPCRTRLHGNAGILSDSIEKGEEGEGERETQRGHRKRGEERRDERGRFTKFTNVTW